MTIQKGKVLIYRVFDVASEINLLKARTLIEKSQNGTKEIKSDRSHKSLIVNNPPIALNIDTDDTALLEKKVEVSAKVWNYGCISLCFSLELENKTLKELNELYSKIDDSEEILNKALIHAEGIFNKIKSSLVKPKINKRLYEDFTVFVVEELKSKDGKVIEVSENDDIRKYLSLEDFPKVIIGEKKLELSENTKNVITKDFFQYSSKDLALVDWDSSFIFDFTKEGIYEQYIQILEFSLTRLLELRIYDEFLDKELEKLYDEVEKSNKKLE